MMKVKAGNPRQLRKQGAWYYLPYGTDKTVSVYCEAKDGINLTTVKIPAQKLLRELIAIGVKP